VLASVEHLYKGNESLVNKVSERCPVSPVARRVVGFVGVLLFLVALVPRIVFVSSGPLQADERHWDARTDRVLEKLRSDPFHATSHLGHPGVFPALVMSTSKVACSFVNRTLGDSAMRALCVDSLSAARLGNALFSSLLPSLLFLVLLKWTGFLEALTVALLAALSPRAIDLSRIAHVDTIHGVVVAATVFSYLAALRLNDCRLKALAGIGFGFCLLTKPTSIALVPALFIAKLLLARLWPKTFVSRGISWSDLWMAIWSLAVFTLLYTRIWHHGESFVEWAAVSHAGPHVLYEIGVALRSGALGEIVLALLSISVVVQVVRWRRAERVGGQWHLTTLVVVLLTWLVVFPASWENLARYWMRVFNLTSVTHQSFAGATLPPAGGYLSYAIAELPPLVFIGVVLAPLLAVPAICRALRPSEQQLVVVSVAVCVCWLAFLSASSKQAWRYALAVAPFCYVVATLTLCALGRRCKLARLPLLALLLLQGAAAVCAFPAWDLYQSSFARVLEPTVRRELVRVRSGQQEALSFLINEAKRERREIFVSVLGDGDVFQREAARSFGADAKLIKLGYFSDYASDYVIVQTTFEVRDPQWMKHTSADPVFRAVSDYGAGTAIYRPIDSELPREVSLPIQKVRRDRGLLNKVDGIEELQLEPSKAVAGYVLAFPAGYRVVGGASELVFQVGSSLPLLKGINPHSPVARFDVTRECSRVVTQAELAAGLQRIVVSCSFTAPRRIFPRVYWFGTAPLSLVGVSVKVAG
jgi:hypothetical protein